MGAVLEKTPETFLTEAAKARQEASRFRRAALIIGDERVVDSLKTRAGELEALAAMLEARATKVLPK